MFSLDTELDIDIIKNRAKEQLLKGEFPSVCGSPDFDEFIVEVIRRQARLTLDLARLETIEDIIEAREESKEFLMGLSELFQDSFTGAITEILEFIERPEPTEHHKSVGRVRRARFWYQTLESPWWDLYQGKDLPGIREKLKEIGKL